MRFRVIPGSTSLRVSANIFDQRSLKGVLESEVSVTFLPSDHDPAVFSYAAAPFLELRCRTFFKVKLGSD